ncbi:MAG: hypothetical protein ACPHLK_10395 [Gammaproteobacteria bacterium]|jgi:TM2 domain-containing membrane protein YozV
MNKSTKAVLLSALLFPGSGHFYLKKPVMGVSLTVISVVCLGFITVSVFKLAKAISDKILNGEIAPDIIEITNAVTEGLADTGLHQLNLLTIVIFSCWIVGMLDSYRIGRKQDLK